MLMYNSVQAQLEGVHEARRSSSMIIVDYLIEDD